MWWAVPGQPAFVLIAIASVSLGDLLAGAVGHRFGRHRYATTAMFTDKTYTRSWEGSACVFATTLIAVVLVRSGLTPNQFFTTLLVVPVVLTLAEAKSPHTWDEPIMFFAAMISAMAIVAISPDAPCFMTMN
jgi:dolichol kinase